MVVLALWPVWGSLSGAHGLVSPGKALSDSSLTLSRLLPFPFSPPLRALVQAYEVSTLLFPLFFLQASHLPLQSCCLLFLPTHFTFSSDSTGLWDSLSETSDVHDTGCQFQCCPALPACVVLCTYLYIVYVGPCYTWSFMGYLRVFWSSVSLFCYFHKVEHA